MLERLLEDLNSRDKETSAAALREVDALEPPELLRLLELEAADFKRLQARKSTVRTIEALLLTSLLGLIAMGVNRFHISEGWQAITLSVYSMSLMALSTGFDIYYDNRYARHPGRRDSLVNLLSHKDDIHLLLCALQLTGRWFKTEIKATIRTALKSRLPQLRATQVASWTKTQKQALLMPLKTPLQDPELTLLLLKTLEQVGDTHAIPAVRKLTKLSSWGAYNDVRNVERINKAAEECLPYLEARIEPTRQSETLLRPSDIAQVAAPDTLLRPAYSHNETPPEQLLRDMASDFL